MQLNTLSLSPGDARIVTAATDQARSSFGYSVLAEAACKITEASRRKRGLTRLGKARFPRADFTYTRYKNDPRPSVLAFGTWKHPDTKNELLCGINLNYLSHRQLERLKKVAKKLFARDTVRARWRFLERVLPDIAKHYYRTYDEKFIRAVQPAEFLGYEPGKDAETAVKAAEVHKEPEKTDDTVDAARSVWQLQRRLYDPETGRRTEPERTNVKGSAKARREKLNRYRSQRRQLRNLERKAEVAKLADKIRQDREADPYGDIEWADELPKQSELGPYESVRYSPELGFIWESTEAYINYHRPDKFYEIRDRCPGKVLAVRDLLTGITLIDAVPDHAFILEQAGWDYDHTMLLSVHNGVLTAVSDIEDCGLIAEEISKSDIIGVLGE